MNTEVKNILKSWSSSLNNYGKLDNWHFSEQVSVLSTYVRSSEDTRELRQVVKMVRDYAVSPHCKSESMLAAIEKVKEMMGMSSSLCLLAKSSKKRVKKEGQQVRFKGQTSRLFEERLKFKGGMMLRNFDIETECAKDSRKVRRIVEKRMCQAYHKMNKQFLDRESNSDRYWSKRATAYQLYNIGQVEHVRYQSRGLSTHWKRVFDPITGETVFKKKMAYSSKEEAMKAIEAWGQNHPSDYRPMHAYKCACCHSWHIGHDSEMIDTYSLSMAQPISAAVKCV